MVDSAAVRLNEPFRARAGLIKPMVHMLRDLAYLLFMVSHAWYGNSQMVEHQELLGDIKRKYRVVLWHPIICSDNIRTIEIRPSKLMTNEAQFRR